MSTENANIKVRNRTVEIKWVSQFCDHIMDKFINENDNHDLNFQQIADLLKRCRTFENNSGRTWYGHNAYKGRKYRVVFILTPKFAVIKTCYRYGYEEN